MESASSYVYCVPGEAGKVCRNEGLCLQRMGIHACAHVIMLQQHNFLLPNRQLYPATCNQL